MELGYLLERDVCVLSVQQRGTRVGAGAMPRCGGGPVVNLTATAHCHGTANLC